MTCFQAKSEGIRYYEWATMVEHIFISCIAIQFADIRTTYYVAVLLYSFTAAYFSYVMNYGIYIEDLSLLFIVLFAAAFTRTGNPQHCYLVGNVSLLSVWMLLREARAITGYSGLGFDIFEWFH